MFDRGIQAVRKEYRVHIKGAAMKLQWDPDNPAVMLEMMGSAERLALAEGKAASMARLHSFFDFFLNSRVIKKIPRRYVLRRRFAKVGQELQHGAGDHDPRGAFVQKIRQVDPALPQCAERSCDEFGMY